MQTTQDRILTLKNRVRNTGDKIGNATTILIQKQTDIAGMEADLKDFDKPNTCQETIDAIIKQIIFLKKRTDDIQHTIDYLNSCKKSCESELADIQEATN